MKCKTERMKKNQQNLGVLVLEEVVQRKKRGYTMNYAEIKNLMSTEDYRHKYRKNTFKAWNSPLYDFTNPKEKNIENPRSNLQLM